MTTTYYSIQVMDDDMPKLVPHTGKKNCEFLDRKQALDFLNKLIVNNPMEKFRLLKRTEKNKFEPWNAR